MTSLKQKPQKLISLQIPDPTRKRTQDNEIMTILTTKSEMTCYNAESSLYCIVTIDFSFYYNFKFIELPAMTAFTRPTQDKASQHSNRDRVESHVFPPLAEKLPIADSSQFSSYM